MIRANTIDKLLREGRQAMYGLFDRSTERSALTVHNENSWRQLAGSSNPILPHTTGCYDPQTLQAHVRGNSPTFISDVFHELYGHGFLMEQSPIGQLLSLATVSELPELLDSDRHEALGIARPLRLNLEAFAIWLEAELCERTGNTDSWHRKRTQLPHTYRLLHEYAVSLHERLTTLGFAKQYGIPMIPRKETVKDVLLKSFPIDPSKGDFAVLHGSRKPTSDIDVFVVTDNIEGNVYWGWLDMYVLSHQQFNALRSNLDLSVTDPIFTGDLVVGDDALFSSIRESFHHLPITPECIAHAEKIARTQCALAANKSIDEKLREKQFRYAGSYWRQATRMRDRKKTMTLNELSVTTTLAKTAAD